MQARIVILPDGGLTVITDQGTFAEGAERITALLSALGAQGVRFAEINPPEQHRHDDRLLQQGQVHHHAHTEARHD